MNSDMPGRAAKEEENRRNNQERLEVREDDEHDGSGCPRSGAGGSLTLIPWEPNSGTRRAKILRTSEVRERCRVLGVRGEGAPGGSDGRRAKRRRRERCGTGVVGAAWTERRGREKEGETSGEWGAKAWRRRKDRAGEKVLGEGERRRGWGYVGRSGVDREYGRGPGTQGVHGELQLKRRSAEVVRSVAGVEVESRG
ncbi:hypothetical protein NDU88_000804 [Pleurodeles waltl]|uniref:Uncharacterized protein n=1 Tax=Pleurodeles waltl TaxID=8319 RepID=A0AAV7M6B8_PLEWA|nr:hypothetical protein NDU88_000804 [Pleurodeles waltl]